MPRVYAVVASFCPGPQFLDNLDAIGQQAPLIVVDDGSPTEFDEVLKRAERPGREVLRSDQNCGIAAALNRGIARALRQGADFIVTFDQDSRVQPDHVATLVQRLRTCPAGVRLAMIGPGHVGRVAYRGRPAVALPDVMLVSEALQSGLCFDAGALEALGLLEEDLFIDGVDTEICLRARARGYAVGVLPALHMEHSLGLGAAAPRYRVGPWRPIATGHTAFRRYYMTRNRLVLLRRYAIREPRWAALTFRRLLVGNTLAITVEGNRWAKLRAMVRGARDAVAGYAGPMDAPTARRRTRMRA